GRRNRSWSSSARTARTGPAGAAPPALGRVRRSRARARPATRAAQGRRLGAHGRLIWVKGLSLWASLDSPPWGEIGRISRFLSTRTLNGRKALNDYLGSLDERPIGRFARLGLIAMPAESAGEQAARHL